ncbi:hypothetical protein [Rubripirellula reticaptiva]|uniref:hypothetical protein n=1 Tax=Rubripirellula reticaptiva TaxID=2528013 RepID=UPI001646A09F|nr:hypothetical protein [Rubripirellula reticaptiva]
MAHKLDAVILVDREKLLEPRTKQRIETKRSFDRRQSSRISTEDAIGDLHRYELQDRYLELTRMELPAQARLGGWIVKYDHCVMRIIYDQWFQG